MAKRDYNSASNTVRDFYRTLRQNQTVAYVTRMHTEYRSREKTEIDIWDAIMLMADIRDSSDPDIDISNIHHLFQVAESMRQDGCPEWMQVVGLIHDLGKIMYLFGSELTGTTIRSQWGVVGDTFIVGCRIPDSVVYPEYNVLNPDMADSRYNTPLGMYPGGCGLSKVSCSWGHDEYLYRVLCDNQAPLCEIEEAMYMIRYHSLYPWHQEGEYSHLTDRKDRELLTSVQAFNKYDLYTKENQEYDISSLKSYYLPLLHKYLGTSLRF
jgi:inositol oxygenase